jgi:hypothetical protein
VLNVVGVLCDAPDPQTRAEAGAEIAAVGQALELPGQANGLRDPLAVCERTFSAKRSGISTSK